MRLYKNVLKFGYLYRRSILYIINTIIYNLRLYNLFSVDIIRNYY